ncbi:MAG: hypothetical protein M3162_03750 [Thermoproteota archaeon]|nr:hypothetical protein [Thermoproteota archaeon]
MREQKQFHLKHNFGIFKCLVQKTGIQTHLQDAYSFVVDMVELLVMLAMILLDFLIFSKTNERTLFT